MKDVDGWVDRVRQDAGPCPACGSLAAMPLIWGMPDGASVEEYGDRVSWGGCCVPEVVHPYRCGECDQSYGEVPEVRPDGR